MFEKLFPPPDENKALRKVGTPRQRFFRDLWASIKYTLGLFIRYVIGREYPK
jgi:hypothetical protein